MEDRKQLRSYIAVAVTMLTVEFDPWILHIVYMYSSMLPPVAVKCC